MTRLPYTLPAAILAALAVRWIMARLVAWVDNAESEVSE